jgi:hypothetical protein
MGPRDMPFKRCSCSSEMLGGDGPVGYMEGPWCREPNNIYIYIYICICMWNCGIIVA